MKWVEHLQNNKNSVIQSLNGRLSALRKVTKYASFKARLAIANGIFMSKLIYMIPVWAGCPEYLKNALQVCQNNAARIVTKHDRSVSVKNLLKECGWRSVRQEMYYHTVLLVHKIILQKTPQYLYSRLTADGSYNYTTRSSSTSSIRRCKSFNTSLALCKDSFKWRGVDWYEALPLSLRSVHNVATFKLNLKSWIKINIPI